MAMVIIALAGTFVLVALGLSVGFGAANYKAALHHDIINSGTRVFVNGTSCVTEEVRRKQSYTLKENVAYLQYSKAVPCHPSNGDEALYTASRLGSYSKGLPHDTSTGVVSPSAYTALLQAFEIGISSYFDLIPNPGSLRLENPQASYVFTSGLSSDSHYFYSAPPAAFASGKFGHELTELYWLSNARDVAFHEYATHAQTTNAAVEINTLIDYGGPLPTVAGTTLFRGTCSVGCLVGPYLSQFLYAPISVSRALPPVLPKINPPTADADFLLTWTEFVNVQNGGVPPGIMHYQPGVWRYIQSGRDLAYWVHSDPIAVGLGAARNAADFLHSLNVSLKTTMPYVAGSYNQAGAATFGPSGLHSELAAIAQEALQAAYFQKWGVHRRLRPEEAGGKLDRVKTSISNWPIHADVQSSSGLSTSHARVGSWLLPQAYPEGAPASPGYVDEYSAVAAACTTFLKFVYDDSHVFAAPVDLATTNSSALVSYNTTSLTVGGELNKLAWNIGLGRMFAGVSWRSDVKAGMVLGEQVALDHLRAKRTVYNEVLVPWTATSFDGTVMIVNTIA